MKITINYEDSKRIMQKLDELEKIISQLPEQSKIEDQNDYLALDEACKRDTFNYQELKALLKAQ